MINKFIKYLFETSLAIFIFFIHITNLLKIDSTVFNDDFIVFLAIFISIVISLVITNKLFNK